MYRRYGLILLLLPLAACSDGPTGPAADRLTVEPTSVVIAVGDTTRLQARADDQDGQSLPGRVRWVSLDPGIASVDRAGLVSGSKQGTARIVAEAGGKRDTVSIHVVPKQYNVRTDVACGSPTYREGRVAAVGEHVIVVADLANPAGGFTDNDYRRLAQRFDGTILPVLTKYFGEPSDVDGNGRVIIFFTSAVNALTPAFSRGYVAGFFFARDLYPRSGPSTVVTCQGSNMAEILYLVVPDPNGTINGNIRPKEVIERSAPGTIAHELQHLINSSRRLVIDSKRPPQEESWLDEGLSHIAEELMFYHASGYSPRRNLGLDRLYSPPSGNGRADFETFQAANFSRLGVYFEEPERHAAYANRVSLGDRGAVWHYLRYLADRSSLDEGELWYRLANSSSTGFENLREVFGLDPLEFYRDWAITLYTDDQVKTVDSRYQLPSWNTRSIIPALGSSLPVPRVLMPGITQNLTLSGGGTAYLQFTIPAGERGEIRVNTGSGTGTGSPGCATESLPLTLRVGEVYTPPRGTGSSAGVDDPICIADDDIPGTYLVVVTSLAGEESQTSIGVTGHGIVAPTTSPTPLAAARLEVARPEVAWQIVDQAEFDAQLRRQELELLPPHRPLEGRGAGLRHQVAAAPGEGGAELVASVVRIR